MRFDFTFGASRSGPRRDAGTPARLLILADLRAATPDPADVVDRPLPVVDIDTIEDVLGRYAPSVTLGEGAGGETLRFRSFDDFHPDALVGTLAVFQRLRNLRGRLQDPATFANAAAELGAEPPERTPGTDTPTPAAGESRSMFERLLGQKEAGPLAADPASRAASPIDRFIRGIVEPHVVSAEVGLRLPQLLSAVDVAMTDTMRRVLHDRGFQQVEAAWRGVRWLVSSLDLGEELQLRLLHFTREELSQGAGPGTPVFRRLVDRESRMPGGLRFSALVGAYRFGATEEDLAALESLGSLAHAAGAPFVAGAEPSLLGASGLAGQVEPREWRALDAAIESRWQALRAGPAAPYLGLALPRVLLRLPYGAASDPIDRFRFEEMPATPEHESFLWGDAAFACGIVMARLLQPSDAPSDPGDIADLPAFVFTADEEPRLQPCAEGLLAEPAIEAVVARGLMPLASFRNRNAVLLVRLQSIADRRAAIEREGVPV